MTDDLKRDIWAGAHTGDGPVGMKAEIRVMPLWAKEGQRVSANRWQLGDRRSTDSPHRPRKEPTPPRAP